MELGVPELLLAAITVLTPIITAIANQSKWSSKVKNGVAFGISALLAVAYLFFTGALTDLNDLPATILAVYGLQQLVYKQFMSELTKKIEAVTDVSSGQTIVVEDEKRNEVIETGEADATVVVVDEMDPAAVDHSQGVDRRQQPLG